MPSRRAKPRGARKPALALLSSLALTLCVLAAPARAQIGSARYSSVVMDAATGNLVSAINPDDPRFPASLTKMMTLYLTFEALRDRRVALDQAVPVSPHAAAQMPSKLGLLPGTRLTVEQGVLALVTKSANDAACALGELLGGDEERFAQMMTLRARALGMTHTLFRNASGLPDLEQTSTARDLAVLARHLVQDFPVEYHYFSVPSFVFHGRLVPNHDHMLQSYPGADGIKTGYIEASGFNLVTSAVRGEVRLIGVVLGAARPGERDQHMAALLDAGFEQLGVPIAPTREPSLAGRLALVASAQAAPVRIAPLRVAPAGAVSVRAASSKAVAAEAVPNARALVHHVASRHVAVAPAKHPAATPARRPAAASSSTKGRVEGHLLLVHASPG